MSPYFSTEPHAYNQDQYSITLRFTPLRPPPPSSSSSSSSSASSSASSQSCGKARGISAADLLFGNDFDRPIRDRLPPGVNTAMGIVKWWIDPGLQGDVYADKPYIYGPALSSFNVVSVGGGLYDEKKGGLWVEEGGDDKAGVEFRRAVGAPADNKARMKWALRQASKERWVWEYDKTYALDFYNPYLDFTNLALKIPGFQIPAVKYLERHKPGSVPRRSHHLRYVLRHRTTGEVYLAVIFSLVLREDVDEDGVWREKSINSSSLDEGTEPTNGVEVDVDDEVQEEVETQLEGEPVRDASLIEAMKKLEAGNEEQVARPEATKDIVAKDEKPEASIADVD
ncbi:UPF0590 protein [Escovopsis weberi]|uniref:UPF0590 protein n=1 Tax=Escovopsis weberi TaxID=150374 RepID=A0A0M8N1R3_ESCWE|nr:UPF0590 protein [Escovopsis weberi]